MYPFFPFSHVFRQYIFQKLKKCLPLFNWVVIFHFFKAPVDCCPSKLEIALDLIDFEAADSYYYTSTLWVVW